MTMRRVKAGPAGAAAAAAAVLLATVGVAGCGSDKAVTTAATPSGSLSAQTTQSTQSASPSRSGPAQAAVGDTIELAGQKDGDRMAVTVTRVIDPAYGSNQYETASAGNRLVAVQFRLQNVGTNDYSDSPTNSAVVVDSQGQQFNATYTRTSAGPAFASPLVIPRGDSALGFITYQLPAGSQVAKVQFTLASGFADQTGQWRVTAVSSGAPAASATTTATATATVTVPATTAPATAGPQQVVEDYYAAINAHDYQRAWALGGKNLNSSYQSFVSGFATTAWDTVHVTGVQGNTASMTLDALQTDGTHKYFSGTYTVVNGVITSASVH